MLTGVCNVKKYSSKFYDLNIYEKTQCVQESERAASARDHSESTPERRMSLLKFCDHGLMRIVRDLIVKKYLSLMLPITFYLLLF